jgi:hypothetical protein
MHCAFVIGVSLMNQTYKDFDATELFCPQCRRSVPVRKRLLLILPEGEKYDYNCVFCDSSIGDKMVKGKGNVNVILR